MDADFLCVIEAKEGDWGWTVPWLEAREERRIVFVDSPVLIDHRQVSYKSIDSPLQIELIAQEIAWKAVLLKMEIRGGENSGFRKALQKAHLGAGLLLSDAADWGCSIAKNAFSLGGIRARQGLRLEGAFRGVPAVIVGAGPSLEKNGHLLKELREKAIILAGGNALLNIPAEPHFAAAVDGQTPLKRHRFWETPFLFQHRTNPESIAHIQGEKILFPDSHYRFLQAETFDGGWTVGTFLTAAAALMGCNPIIFVGMDYSYRDGRKYAGREEGGQCNLIETLDLEGKAVWTQTDWLMAKSWTEEWAQKHPETRFINATEGGLGFADPVETSTLGSLLFDTQGDLTKRVYDAVFSLPFAQDIDWEKWRASLERCRDDDCEGEAAYETLLKPLWATWMPIFARALQFDPHPDKLWINRQLFFQKVIEEHLHATE